MERVAELSEQDAERFLRQLQDEEMGPYVPLTEEQKASVRRGMADIKAGRKISHEELERRLGIRS